MATANATITGGAPGLTVEHVRTSLAQIETWLGAVRLALGGLDPETPLPMDVLAAPVTSALRVKKDCPPVIQKKKKTTTKKKR